MFPTQPHRAPQTGGMAAQAVQAALDCERQGRPAEALKHYQRALALAPQDPAVLGRLSSLLVRIGRPQEAVRVLADACRRNPRDATVRQGLGTAYLAAHDLKNAETHLRKAAKLAPKSAIALRALGDWCVAAEKPDEAESVFRRALALAPGDIELRVRLAGLLALVGRNTEARDLYRQLIDEGVRNPLIHAGLVATTDYSGVNAEPAEYSVVRATAESASVPPPLRRMLHFSAAKIDRALKRREAEFDHYARAGSLFAERFDLDYFRDSISALKQSATPEFFAARRSYADKSTRPIFIFGMPRSGTTLTEQILAAHPSVAAAGELTFFPEAVRALGLRPQPAGNSLPPERRPEAVHKLAASDARRLAVGYLERLQFRGAGKMRVTDKMPENFLHLWLIALLFPQATFIHCVRDPMATCFSCYTTDIGEGHNYTSDFFHLASYYRIYEDLMRHWIKVLPVELFENRYEDMVLKPEESVRKLLDAARLPWNDASMAFHESGRTALTASYSEVRKPIHAENLERWRAYEQYVAPLRRELEHGEVSR